MKLLIFLFCTNWVSGGREDCYGLIGVGKKDAAKTIKSAYRKKAAKMHPDKNKDDPNANQKFQDLAWCNEVLTDDKKRKKYDRGGEDAINNDQGGEDFDMGGFGGGFGGMFGNMFGFGNQQQGNEIKKGDLVLVPVMVTLEELYNGALIDIMRTKRTYVETGGQRDCNCKMEMRQKRMGMGQFQIFQEQVCEKCPNVKLVAEDEELEVEIERGMDHGEELEYFGEGEPQLDGEPGDLKVVLRLQKHPIFERRGNDLYTNLTISLEDALVGFSTTIKHLDGHTVHVKRDGITWHGFKMRVNKEGMPSSTDNTKLGSLIVTLDVAFPKTELTPDQKETIRKMLQQDDVKPDFYNGIKFPRKKS